MFNFKLFVRSLKSTLSLKLVINATNLNNAEFYYKKGMILLNTHNTFNFWTGHITSLKADLRETLVVSINKAPAEQKFLPFWWKESFTYTLSNAKSNDFFAFVNVSDIFYITFNNMMLMKLYQALLNFFCYFWLFLEIWNFEFWIFEFLILDEYSGCRINWFLPSRFEKVSISWKNVSNNFPKKSNIS